MSSTLEGKVAIVTGASSGIGRATALAFGRERMQLVLAGRTHARLEETAERVRALGGQAIVRAGDVRLEEEVVALVETAASAYGHLDVLVNAAGVGFPGPATAGRIEEWRETLETNVLGLCVACREAARVMTGRGGTLVNVSSVAGSEPAPGDALYAASKHAVNGFSDSLRLELGGSGIRVLVVEPGQTMTSFGRNVPHARLVELGRALGLAEETIPNFQGGHAPQAFVEAVLRAQPARFLAAEDVATTIVDALCAPDPAIERITLRPGAGGQDTSRRENDPN